MMSHGGTESAWEVSASLLPPAIVDGACAPSTAPESVSAASQFLPHTLR
jgi:hypothetical protein